MKLFSAPVVTRVVQTITFRLSTTVDAPRSIFTPVAALGAVQVKATERDAGDVNARLVTGSERRSGVACACAGLVEAPTELRALTVTVTIWPFVRPSTEQ